jgi:MFS family permease
MQQNIINTQPRFCYKCHHPAGNFDKKCVRCGGVVRTKATIRILGVVLVFLGGFISALMAFIGMFIYGALMQSNGSRFNGSENELLLVVGIIGLTFVVGISFALAGLWQIIFGRRNTIIVWVSIGLVIVLFVVGRIFVAMTR